MKIALLWPNYWPYVRRGTERMVRDIAYHLISQGHSVDVITSTPGPSRVDMDGDVTLYRQSRLDHPLLRYATRAIGRLVYYFDLQGVRALPHLLKTHYDMAHSFAYIYWPDQALLRRRGTPTVFHVVTIPPHWGRTGEEAFVRKCIENNTPVRVFSKYCADFMTQAYGIPTHVVPPTVDEVFFQPLVAKNLDRPKILYTADLVEPVKGPHVLAKAFNEVHRLRPDAVLQLAGPIGFRPASVNELMSLIDPEARQSVELLGAGSLGNLPKLYAEAAVTVLPSLNEPFGMVMTESLASGTVTVGTRSGAIPEIISSPDVGLLFDRDPADNDLSARNLARALVDALDLAATPGASARCQQHARQWTWPALADAFEEMHRAAFRAMPGARGATLEMAG